MTNPTTVRLNPETPETREVCQAGHGARFLGDVTAYMRGRGFEILAYWSDEANPAFAAEFVEALEDAQEDALYRAFNPHGQQSIVEALEAARAAGFTHAFMVAGQVPGESAEELTLPIAEHIDYQRVPGADTERRYELRGAEILHGGEVFFLLEVR